MSDARHWLTLLPGLGVALVTGSACTIVDDPNHCANMTESPCLPAEVCDPCTPSSQTTNENGCVMPDDVQTCSLASGASTTDTTAGPTTMATEVTDTDPPVTTTTDPDTTATDGETETTTGDPVDCEEPDGTFEGTCSGTTPFCVGGKCEPCTQEAGPTSCEGTNRPVCDSSGACVVCNAAVPDACEGDTPYCQPATNTCVPCTAHDQCGAAACNLFTGACVAGPVVTVGSGQMHPNLLTAVAAVGGGGTIIVHAGQYDETVTVDGGVVAFLANDGDAVVWQRTMGAGAPQLRVTGGATVLLDELELRGNNSIPDPAVRVDGASLWVDRSIIAQNDGVAVRGEVGAEVMMRNSFVTGASDLAAINNITGATMTIQYSTVGAALGASNAILCDGNSEVTVSDSILLTRGTEPEVVCPMFSANRTSANTMLPGTDNVDVGAPVLGWFVNYATGDLHLTETGQMAFMATAEWNDGDPLVDIDGEDRSGVDGTPERPGADVPQ